MRISRRLDLVLANLGQVPLLVQIFVAHILFEQPFVVLGRFVGVIMVGIAVVRFVVLLTKLPQLNGSGRVRMEATGPLPNLILVFFELL